MSDKQPYPLTPLTMAILLALTKEELHGYALMREVEAQTDGSLIPGTGSLYAALQRLEEEGLVEPAIGRRKASGEDGRRKYFRITAAGCAAAREEARRMLRVLETAHEKELIRGLPPLRGAR